MTKPKAEDYPRDHYPVVQKYFDELELMGMPPTPEVRKLQETAIGLIDRHGGGTPEEKEASMVAAALILYPPSVFIEIGRFFEPGYGPEVEQLVQTLISTPPGAFMPAMLAQAQAAAGIAVMDDMAKNLKGGALPAPAHEILPGMKEAYGQDMSLFSYLDAPDLLARYETTRDAIFAGLEKKIRDGQPRKPFKPAGGDFDM